jgi:membrane-bound serine protease (ClpP class)
MEMLRRWAWAALLALAVLLPGGAPGAAREAPLLVIDGPIGPATSDYVHRQLRELDPATPLVILKIDTPGGLDGAMRAIIRDILASEIPIVAWVAPSGARAASAGTYILYASHVAAMAPGTNLGAATPIQIGGMPGSPQPADPGESDDADGTQRPAGTEDKLVNDAVAYIRGLAELRDRNADWAEAAVRRAESLSAREALARNVIEIVAANLDELLAALDGREVALDGRSVTLDTTDLAVTEVEPDWRTRLLAFITQPTVAYVLMLIGIYGIIIEFYTPGLVGPGLIGVISLLLAFYAFQLLPVSWAAFALIVFGIVLMIAEAFAPSFGVLGIAGIVAFVVGSIMLVDTDAPGFELSWQLIGSLALFGGATILAGSLLAARSFRRPVVSGAEELAAATGTVLDWSGGSGHVRVHGEVWKARGSADLAAGEPIAVRRRDGLTLEVARSIPTDQGETR